MHIYFGKRLKELREEKQKTQEDIAKITGFERSTVAKWETTSTTPNAEALDLLATYFNVSVDYLLGRTDARDERRHSADRRKLSVNWMLDRDDELAQEHSGDVHGANGNRMIGPELAYSTGLEAAAKALGFELDIEVLEIANAAPPSDVAAILGLAKGEQALKSIQIQNIDGVPLRVITSWMPIDLFADIVDRQGKPLYEMLEETKGIYAVKVEERIRSSSMTAELANLLKTDLGKSALEIQRVVHADIGRILEVSFIVAAGRLWELSYTYAAGGRISAPDWMWLRYAPA
ncbi:MAG: UTRA domain-containing protein [Dehalococcoidia bacterium]